MKKKIFALLVSMVMALIALCGCAKDPVDNNTYEDDLRPAENYLQTVASLSGTDDFGRGFTAYEELNHEKYVGIYYLPWHGEHPSEQDGIYNISELLRTEQGTADLWDITGPSSAPKNKYFYWGEPLYGYYNIRDPWVIRRHIELFINAGIDFLCMDTSNGFPYIQANKIILDILLEYQEQGWKVPQVMFMPHTSSFSVVRSLVDNLYNVAEYENLWFAPHGKPMITCAREDEQRIIDYVGEDFFELRIAIWPTMHSTYSQEDINRGWAWIDWNKFHTNYGGMMNVSIAQHVGLPFSVSVQFENSYDNNWGRGWNYDENRNVKEDVIKNTNFEYQWADVLSYDPEIIHVTGWNEWMAIKFVDNSTTAFIDTCNEEFSRDIEMTKEGYKDNAYVQLATNIRKRKAADGTLLKATARAAIDINKRNGQWQDKGRVYQDLVGDAIERDYQGINRTVHYTDNSNRNDIAEVRMAHNSKYLYYYISTAEPLLADYTQENFMNILIGVNGQKGENFEGYQYVINRKKLSADTVSIEKCIGGYNWEQVGEAKIVIRGNYVQIAVPRSALNLGKKVNETIQFKVTDNIQHPEDITDYYISGDSAPLGRLNYTYKCK